MEKRRNADRTKYYYGNNSKIERTAEQLLGRGLFSTDGIRDHKLIEEAEGRLHITIPNALKQFYYFVGRQELFMTSFQKILLPDELWCDGRYLFFAKENQGVCSWLTDLTEFQVYQEVEGSCYSEDILLEEFLLLLMYYNCAQSGYEYRQTKKYNGNISDISVDVSWERVVQHNGLVIYAKDDNLIWCFYDINSEKVIEEIYMTSRTKEGMDKWQFQS